MHINLRGKNALITGGATGIGKQIAIELSKCGANVSIHYHRNSEGAKETEAQIRNQNVKTITVQGDVLQKKEINTFVNKVSEFFNGRIDILVNNAGGLVKRTLIEETSEETWKQIIDLNLTSAFFVTQTVLPFMKMNGGSIINITSLAAHTGGGVGAIPYATAKAGLTAFTKGLANEIAKYNIRVNAVSPGLIGNTPFHDTFTSCETRQRTVHNTPLKREGTPKDVSGTVLFLASELSSFMTGETIEVNGGVLMR